jgi:LPS export ABC transporter protein LptC
MWFEMKTNFLKTTSCVIALAACAVMSACQKPTTAPAGEEIPDLKAERVMYGMDTYSSSGTARKSRTHADTAYMFNRNDSSVVQLRGMTVEMFDVAGNRTAKVSARQGALYPDTKIMVARGNVVLITADGKRVTTEELHYDQNSHRVWSNSHTVVVNPNGSRQTMESFTTDDKFRSISATGARGSTGIKL